MNQTSAVHQKPGISSSLYKPLTDTAVKKIAESVFELLEKSGMAVYSKTAFEAYKKAGAVVSNSSNIVKLPRSMVEDGIASNPKSITLYSRDGKFDAILTKNKVHYGTGGTAIYVLDPDTGERRPSLIKDVILNSRIVQQLENVHVFTINVFPNEISNINEIDVNRFFHALNNTTKHVMGGIYSMDGCKNVVKMVQTIAGSPEALRNKPFVSFITLIISPFKVDDRYGEITCYLAHEGLPVVVPTEPICGTTSPMTLASNVLTHIAETIGGIVLIQSVKKGSPGICGGVGSITDIRNMNHLGGPIERAMINAAVSQMAQYFEIPYYGTAGTTDSKEVDIQAAYESAMSSLLVAMSGANYIHDIAGLMESDLTVSYEKLVMDNEILGMCQRVLRGIEVNDDTLALELMVAKGPAQDYLAEEHSIKYMRSEFYMPKIANRDKREISNKAKDAYSNAVSRVREIRHATPYTMIEQKVRDSILQEFPEIRMQMEYAINV